MTFCTSSPSTNPLPLPIRIDGKGGNPSQNFFCWLHNFSRFYRISMKVTPIDASTLALSNEYFILVVSHTQRELRPFFRRRKLVHCQFVSISCRANSSDIFGISVPDTDTSSDVAHKSEHLIRSCIRHRILQVFNFLNV